MNEQQFKDLLAEHDILLTETQEKQFRRYFGVRVNILSDYSH